MTIRVSRDNGETFSRKTTYEIDRDKPPVPLVSFVWPPCKCALHRTADTQERRTA